jgi:putative membrane protein
MKESHYTEYTQYTKQNMILRDYLAVDRTIMTNETSFLSYIRTALTLVVAGVTFIKFFNDSAVHFIGWIFIACGLLVVVTGFGRYEAMNRVLLKVVGRHEFAELDLESAGVFKKLAVLTQRFGKFFY